MILKNGMFEVMSCEPIRGIQKKRDGVWNVQTDDNIVACVTKSSSDKSAEVHCPPLDGHGCELRD